MPPRSLVWSLAFLALPGAVLGATLKPASVTQFFVTPEKPARLQWKVEAGTLAEPLEYSLRDYGGSSTGVSPVPVSPGASGRAKLLDGGAVEVALQPHQGFFEIEFPATKQRFGIVSLPASQDVPPDKFFCIDGALSWLVRDDEIREGLVQAAHRSGIRTIRERLTWGAVHPAPDRWDWQTDAHYDTLRRACLKHRVEVLEMAHDGPRWMGHVGPRYPENLVASARSWQKIAQQWRPTWGGLEVWNEPDIFFGGNLPADQYVPLVKAISHGLGEPLPLRWPLVGGVMAHCNRQFLDTAARNGILDSIDVFSFHTYSRAPEMEGLVEKYRAWLKDYGHESMPLWLTECGRPWKTGPERPPVDQDAESALDITMKAVEAKACGIDRYFAFVYPYFEEGKNNFGMMDKRATPLRSFAAYAQMARVLANRSYLGDLKHNDKRLLRARVFLGVRAFDTPREVPSAIAVLYTGRVDPAAMVKIELPVSRIEGIDGRELKPTAAGEIPVPGGMVYVWPESDDALGLETWQSDETLRRVDTKTKAVALRRAARQRESKRIAPSPIILRYQWDDKLVEPTSEGYRFRADPPKKMPVAVRVFNLANQPRELKLRLSFHEKEVPIVGPNPQQAKVPAEGFVDVRWEADVSIASAPSKGLRVIVTAQSEGDPRPATLAFDLMEQKRK
jgi:hypothetical protein